MDKSIIAMIKTQFMINVRYPLHKRCWVRTGRQYRAAILGQTAHVLMVRCECQQYDWLGKGTGARPTVWDSDLRQISCILPYGLVHNNVNHVNYVDVLNSILPSIF